MTITFTHALVLAAANPAPIFGNPMVFMGGDNFFLTFDKASIASVNKLKNEKSSAKPEKNDSEEEKK